MISKSKLLISLLSITGVCMFLREYMAGALTLGDVLGPDVCTKCLTRNDAFVRNLNSSVPPFLSPQSNLSLRAFNWWKKLQFEKRDLDSYQATVESLFQTFPRIPEVASSSSQRSQQTCAVVGNSANLKGSRYGHLIDLHNVIIRMNTGRTAGYEEDVGTRTTHRVMYPESAVDLDDQTHLVLFPFKIMDIEWLIKALTTGFTGKSYMPVKSTIKANKDLVMVVNPAFMMHVHEVWLAKRGKYPSTGFMALVLALHMCEEVHVFGFGADKDGNWSHYWEALKNKKLKTGLHPGDREYRLILELSAQHKLKFFRGW